MPLSQPNPKYLPAHTRSNAHNHSQGNTHYREDLEQVLSGSETEREGNNLNHRLSLASLGQSSSSDDQSVTPPSSIAASAAAFRASSRTGMIPPTSPHHRPRRTSLPASPGKTFSLARSQSERNGERAASPGPSKTPKKRPSTAAASIPALSPDYDDDDGEDLTSAALAAVARSRSPMSMSGSANGKAKRAALPREFMGRDRRSLDGRVSFQFWRSF